MTSSSDKVQELAKMLFNFFKTNGEVGSPPGYAFAAGTDIDGQYDLLMLAEIILEEYSTA